MTTPNGLLGCLVCILMVGCLFASVHAQPNLDCPNDTSAHLQVGQKGYVLPGPPNNIRTEPSTASDLIGQIPPASIFDVLEGPECTEGYVWWLIEYNGEIGWTVAGDGNNYYLELFTNENDLENFTVELHAPSSLLAGLSYYGGGASDEGEFIRGRCKAVTSADTELVFRAVYSPGNGPHLTEAIWPYSAVLYAICHDRIFTGDTLFFSVIVPSGHPDTLTITIHTPNSITQEFIVSSNVLGEALFSYVPTSQLGIGEYTFAIDGLSLAPLSVFVEESQSPNYGVTFDPVSFYPLVLQQPGRINLFLTGFEPNKTIEVALYKTDFSPVNDLKFLYEGIFDNDDFAYVLTLHVDTDGYGSALVTLPWPSDLANGFYAFFIEELANLYSDRFFAIPPYFTFPFAVVADNGMQDQFRNQYRIANVQRDDTLNVRSGPGVGNIVVGQIPFDGSEVYLIGEAQQVGDSLWVPIQWYTLTGWVNSRYLDWGMTTICCRIITRVVSVASNDTLNVRSGPGVENKIVGELPYNATDVYVIPTYGFYGEGSRWYPITWNNITGWVNSNYLE